VLSGIFSWNKRPKSKYFFRELWGCCWTHRVHLQREREWKATANSPLVFEFDKEELENAFKSAWFSYNPCKSCCTRFIYSNEASAPYH